MLGERSTARDAPKTETAGHRNIIARMIEGPQNRIETFSDTFIKCYWQRRSSLQALRMC